MTNNQKYDAIWWQTIAAKKSERAREAYEFLCTGVSDRFTFDLSSHMVCTLQSDAAHASRKAREAIVPGYSIHLW